MNDAVSFEKIGKSPCRKITLPSDRRQEITVLTAAEVAELAAVMPE